MNSVTSHVLDTSVGRPARGMVVRLDSPEGVLAEAVTDANGRVGPLGPADLSPDVYRLRFATGAYFAALGQPVFFPEVAVSFVVAAGGGHHHVPLLLSPFGYSTYRGG